LIFGALFRFLLSRVRQVIEGIRIEVNVVGPGDRSRLMVDVDLREKSGIAQGGEDGAVGFMEPASPVNNSARSISEGQSETVGRKNFDGLDPGVHG